jgi:Fic family protein
VLRLHEALQIQPILSSSKAAACIGASAPTVNNAFRKLESLGLVHEMTGGHYGRLYAYTEYLSILSQNDEPL